MNTVRPLHASELSSGKAHGFLDYVVAARAQDRPNGNIVTSSNIQHLLDKRTPDLPLSKALAGKDVLLFGEAAGHATLAGSHIAATAPALASAGVRTFAIKGAPDVAADAELVVLERHVHTLMGEVADTVQGIPNPLAEMMRRPFIGWSDAPAVHDAAAEGLRRGGITVVELAADMDNSYAEREATWARQIVEARRTGTGPIAALLPAGSITRTTQAFVDRPPVVVDHLHDAGLTTTTVMFAGAKDRVPTSLTDPVRQAGLAGDTFAIDMTEHNQSGSPLYGGKADYVIHLPQMGLERGIGSGGFPFG